MVPTPPIDEIAGPKTGNDAGANGEPTICLMNTDGGNQSSVTDFISAPTAKRLAVFLQCEATRLAQAV